MADDETPDEAARFSVLDLTLDQIALIEDASGIPFPQWHDEDKPRGKLDALLMSAFLKQPLKKTGSMTMRDMMAARTASKDADPNP